MLPAFCWKSQGFIVRSRPSLVTVLMKGSVPGIIVGYVLFRRLAPTRILFGRHEPHIRPSSVWFFVERGSTRIDRSYYTPPWPWDVVRIALGHRDRGSRRTSCRGPAALRSISG